MSASERRNRNKLLEEEDATQLKLGPEFNPESAAIPLSIAETRLLLLGRPPSDNIVYKKTLDYVNTFGKVQRVDALTPETITSLQQAFQNFPPLQTFEVVQLINLNPNDHEEAKSLIPSLTVEKDALDGMLQASAQRRNN